MGFLVCVVIHARFSSQQNLPPYQIPKFVLPQHFPSLSSQQARAPFYFRWAITSFTAVRISWIVCLGSLAPKMAVPATRTLEPAHKDQSCAPNLIKPAILPLPIYPFSGVRVFLAIYKKKTKKKTRLTGLGALTSIARSNTTIDLDVLSRESLPQFLDLFEAFGHELLTTSARADGHDEQEIGSLTERVGDGPSWGFR